jgi:hypothetical protein
MWQIGGYYQGGIILSPAYQAAVTGALALLAGEADGFAIDATTENGTVAVISTGDPTDNLSNVAINSSNLVQSGTSPKYVHWGDGTLHTVAAGEVAQWWGADESRYGILIEPAATNLRIRSQDFGNAEWGNNNSSEAQDATAPDGTTTAWTITENSSAGAHGVFGNTGHAVVSGTTYSLSCYVGVGTRRYVIIGWDEAGTGAFVTVDTNGGAFSIVDTDASGDTLVSSSLEILSATYCRVKLTTTASNNAQRFAVIGMSDTAAPTSIGQSYTGDGASTIIAWGFQVEASSFITSYIPTVGTTVVRAMDYVYAPQSSFPAYATGASVVFYGQLFSLPSDTTIVDWGQADGSDTMLLYNTTAPSAKVFISAGGLGQADFLAGNVVISTEYKFAARAAANDFHAAVDGTLSGAPDTSGTLMAVADNIALNYQGGGTAAHAIIHQLTVLPRALGNAELQALTA